MESDGSREFRAHHPRLFALAYRMLGSAREAEDAVREARLRWNGTGRSTIRSAETWLTGTVVNLCRARLVTARVRRAGYAGPWLPEPVPTARGELGPLESAEERGLVSLALLAALERLEPVERAVFVLREGFGYAHREIADLLALSEAAAVQTYRAAGARLPAGPDRAPLARDAGRALLESLLKAARAGADEELERLLAAEVVLTVDSGGRDRAALRPLVGAELVARYLAGLFPAERPELEIALEEVNGGPAAVARLAGNPMLIIDVAVREALVTSVRVVSDAGKLAYFRRLTC
ncbi:sigma factor [Nocardia sp. NPDC048505]|uniref:sigma factor n=1 Tax=unclassified Nocardia TaxID=2637762 RepID=UPI00340B8BB3